MLLLKKTKKIMMVVILAGCAVWGTHEFFEGKPSAAATPAASGEVSGADAHVKAYYFHGNFRCGSCRTIEKYSREAVETYFDKQLKDGTLVFQTVNVDKPENKHFIQKYQLVTRSLVLVEYKDGKQVKWKNLQKVWQHLNNEDAFFTYVKTETEKYLKDL